MKSLTFYSFIGYRAEWYFYHASDETCEACKQKRPCLGIDVNAEYGCCVCYTCIESLKDSQ